VHGIRPGPIGVVSAILFVALLTLTAFLPGAARGQSSQDQTLTVMTYNIYQGTELQAVLTATTTLQLLLAVSTDFGHMLANNFPERAGAIASEIATAQPDLIGLQEVARWQTSAISSTCASSTTTLDYLQVLLGALSARGLSYSVAASVTNFDVQSPGLFPCGLMNVRLTDHDVILVKSSDLTQGDVSISNAQAQNFVNDFSFTFFGGTITVLEGWASVDVSIQGDPVRFVTTHLDGFSPTVRAAQATELVNGPLNTAMPVLLAGDFNSVITGSASAVFTAAGFSDAWSQLNPSDPGFSASQTNQNGVTVDVINNPTSFLTERIDHAVTRGDVQATSAFLVGADPSTRTASGLWPSDHAGLVVVVAVAQGNNQQ
jgi:endonuclease/exonuclease/phosphatase family metal-dependent hydrolase